MSALKTAGELRGFLADVLVGIKDGSIDANKANAIAKVSAQINQSLAVEVNTALQMERMGKGVAAPGSMIIAGTAEDDVPVVAPTPEHTPAEVPVPATVPERTKALAPSPAPKLVETKRRDGDKIWCEQCETRVTTEQALRCRSAHCKAKALV